MDKMKTVYIYLHVTHLKTRLLTIVSLTSTVYHA